MRCTETGRPAWGMALASKRFEIAVFEGDGIGPEIMAPTLRLLEALSAKTDMPAFSFTTYPAGAGHYAKHGESLPALSLDGARGADAILLSAMGLPSIRYPDGTEISPQIELRMELELYGGLRPVRITPSTRTPLALRPNQSVDFMLIRESTEGLFWSMGKGEVTEDDARETLRITRATSEKLFRLAFRIAQQRKASGVGPGHVTCVDKANVFRAFAFFREIFEGVATEFPDVASGAAYVDATALWMVQSPERFDVLVTENMFGDILSDLGAGLMGGLGFAPSADVGDAHGVFQPCHGSAPDIAGRRIANPIAMFLSAAMMLDWLGVQHDDVACAAGGDALRAAVDQVLADNNVRTPDLGGTASTDDMGDAVIAAL